MPSKRRKRRRPYFEQLERRYLLSAIAVEHDQVGYFFHDDRAGIERYDIDNETWLAPVSLPAATGPPTAAHVDDDGVYLAFGQIVYRYDLDGSAQTHLFNTPQDVVAIHSDGDVIFVNHSSGKYAEPAGGIGAKRDSPLHTSDGFTHPIRIAPDGSVVVLGSGLIHDAITLERRSEALSNSIVDAAWLGNDLYTLGDVAGATQAQYWTLPSYELVNAATMPGTPAALLPLSADQLLVVTHRSNGIPDFTVFSADLSPVSWQNKNMPLDLNGDGLVTPVPDLIARINEMNHRRLVNRFGHLPMPPPSPIPFYYDVNGDHLLTPVQDILPIREGTTDSD